MSNIPKLRFPEFKGEWEKKKLSIIGEYIGGGTPDTSVQECWEGNIPWISSSDLIENDIHNINVQKHITNNAIKNSATKKIPTNSLIIVSRVGVGKFAINKSEVCTSQDFTNIVIDTKVFNANFSAYNLYKNIDILYNISQGTSIKGFTVVDLKKTEISFPTLPEQTKIAEFFTAIDKKISQLKTKKVKLQQYKKGVMQQLFSQKLRFNDEDGKAFPEWELKKFSSYIKLYRGSSPRPINKFITDSDNGVNWIKIGDMKLVENCVVNEVSEKITIEGALHSRKVEIGELILANSMSFGKTYLLNISGCIYDGWFVLREYEGYFYRSFLLQLLNSAYLQKQYKTLSTGGVVQNISSEIVYSTNLLKPPLPEQTKIANFLSSIDEKINSTETQIQQTQAWKKGLLQKMFV